MTFSFIRKAYYAVYCQFCETIGVDKKAIFKNMMYDLFNRLKTKKKRVIAKRQIEILKLLLERDLQILDLIEAALPHYGKLRAPKNAVERDIGGLVVLGAIEMRKDSKDTMVLSARLDWPETITATKFFEIVRQLPKSKSYKFL